MQSRKRLVDVVYTSQILSGEDYRLRHITNLVVLTKVVRFPVFRLDFRSPQGVCLKRPKIKYGEDVLGLYDTYEVVEQKVSLARLRALRKRAYSKSVFKQVLNVRYNLELTLGGCVYELLGRPNGEDMIAELLEGHGFKLVDSVGASPLERLKGGLGGRGVRGSEGADSYGWR